MPFNKNFDKDDGGGDGGSSSMFANPPSSCAENGINERVREVFDAVPCKHFNLKNL